MTRMFRPRQGALDPRVLTALETRLRGTLIRPGDASYESQRRVWNGSIDRYPASIARCADAADVATALRFIRTHGLLVAVRGGGHSFPGHSVCDDGMVIDLSLMKGIRVDPDARAARVQAGVLLAELDQATQAYVLAVTAGIVTHTGSRVSRWAEASVGSCASTG
jgi:FAD/FMN-containing dehydrogenase